MVRGDSSEIAISIPLYNRATPIEYFTKTLAPTAFATINLSRDHEVAPRSKCRHGLHTIDNLLPDDSPPTARGLADNLHRREFPSTGGDEVASTAIGTRVSLPGAFENSATRSAGCISVCQQTRGSDSAFCSL